jgi:dTDP-4-dehydrorhamnose reductase
MISVLITGITGLLGSTLAATADGHSRVFGLCRVKPPAGLRAERCFEVDIANAGAVRDAVVSVRPQIVFHCAAETNVDRCEDDPDLARRVNVEGTRHVACASRDVGASLVYVSTDSVFDGQRGGYSEADEPRPLNAYARSKREGERVALEECPSCTVVRVNFYGWNLLPHKKSLLEWILSELHRGGTIQGFRDVVFAPLSTKDLSGILLDIAERGLQGLYHAGSRDALSKYEFARMAAALFGFDPGRVREASVDEARLRAPRPKSTWLAVGRLEEALGAPLPTARESLKRLADASDNA